MFILMLFSSGYESMTLDKNKKESNLSIMYPFFFQSHNETFYFILFYFILFYFILFYFIWNSIVV